jgi:UDP:flavonoid glycosyltransferase YjiC (YdhE family)
MQCPKSQTDSSDTAKKILYVSGSLGLGHITRDLAIADELRRLNPALEVTWVAAHPASRVIQEAGEKLHPGASDFANDNDPAEKAAKGTQLNLLKYLMNASREWNRNFKTICGIISSEHFDLVIGDETYEIVVGFQKKPRLKTVPFVMIYDFIGLEAMSSSPLEKLGIYVWNRIWSKDFKSGKDPVFDLGLFIGEKEDVPDRTFGFRLPNRRDLAYSSLKFVGYILPFDAGDYSDTLRTREKLGYGEEPLIVCAIGGTSVGRELLNLCAEAFPSLKEQLPGLRMVLVCGPRLSPGAIEVPSGVEVKGYVPALYEHFAACDLAIVQGGGATTLELSALHRPFLYFPLEGHFEQTYVAERLARHRAGVRMSYSQTTPQMLTEAVLSSLGKEASTETIPTGGAQIAAKLISRLL